MSDTLKNRDEHMARVLSEREAARLAALAANPRSSLQEPEEFDWKAHYEAMAAEFAGNAPPPGGEDQRRERARRLIKSGIKSAITPQDFAWLVTDTLPENTHALRTVKRWAHVRAQGRRAFTMLVLLGDTGRGKTVSAGYLIARFGGFHCTMEDLVMSRATRDQALFERAAAAHVLHVDELFTESDDRRAQGALFYLLNQRVGLAQGWTMLTGNPPAPEDPNNPPAPADLIAERYGERTMRRIQHQGEFVQVEGEDLRRAAKGQRGG